MIFIMSNYSTLTVNISSSSSGVHGPSLHSSSTVPLSRERRECHCPAGMLMSVPPGTMSISAVRAPESSKGTPRNAHAGTPPSRKWSGVDGWGAPSPARWHSACAGTDPPANCASQGSSGGAGMPWPGWSRH